MIGSPRIKELFNDLIELPDEARRARLLEQCGEDAVLRERVETLLRAYETADGMLADPTVGTLAVLPDIRAGLDPLGQSVGPYRLLEKIGEGGFGTVYRAEQREPVQRMVALKILKLGMDTRQVITRFEAERIALARMDHPHIARVLDAGATDASSALGAGRPYFVMELVSGLPITQFCDEHALPLRERLELFADACRGVQHAHQKGVIHRDLKPSNVLVTRYDEKPVVKIIDFGIAKATSGRLTEKTLFTELRQMIGTPAYMSPEQAGLSDLDVDTRSDIYSLSVLLYELLSGTTPFNAERLRTADFDELRRIIREEEPPKPSTRLSGWKPMPSVPSGGDQHAEDRTSSSQQIAQHRRTDPRSLVRSLHGELDWIVMKGLEKDRARRYETCDAMALDVERYLRHEPVLASPPSRLYRLKKLVRRNRAAVVAGTMVSAALLAGIAGTTLGLLRAEERRADAEEARKREREQRELAEAREQETRQVAWFHAEMLSSLDALAIGRRIEQLVREKVRAGLEQRVVGAPPAQRKLTPEEVEAEMAAFDERTKELQGVDVARAVMHEFVLGRAADALEDRFADQQLVKADLRFALGRTYRSLGMVDPAEEHVQAALEIYLQFCSAPGPHPRLAECHYHLAGILGAAHHLPEAERHYDAALDHWRQLDDAEHVAKALEAKAGVVMFQGRLDDAELLLDEALRLKRDLYPEEHPDFVNTLNTFAILLSYQGRHEEAVDLGEQVLEVRRGILDDGDPILAETLCNLASYLGGVDRHEEAESLLEEALAIHRAHFGDDHLSVAKNYHQLGVQVEAQSRHDDAERHYRRARDLLLELRDDQRTLRWTNRGLIGLLQRRNEFAEAVELARESLEIAEREYPEGDRESWRRFAEMNLLGTVLASHARVLFDTDPERALAAFEEAAPLIVDGLRGMRDDPNALTNQTPVGIDNRKRNWEGAIQAFQFWNLARPGRGFGESAEELRAELKQLESR